VSLKAIDQIIILPVLQLLFGIVKALKVDDLDQNLVGFVFAAAFN
jgi:hypothetical protein